MNEYDAIIIGTGSGMIVAERLMKENPDARVAVIDKDMAGGICLTRGCIPSKLIISPVEVIYDLESLSGFVDAEIKGVDFRKIMKRMRSKIDSESKMIEKSLKESDRIKYFRSHAEFVSPYTLEVDGEQIRSERIFIGSGSRPMIPEIDGLESSGYLTSDSLLYLEDMPESLVIIGGGYIALEYGNFFARAGCDVTIVEMLPRILSNEEPEISRFVHQELSEHADILTSHRVMRVEKSGEKKVVHARCDDGKKAIESEEILVAVGRKSNSDILKPEKGGIETDERGWIKINEYLETNVRGVYAVGDANGKYMFRHVANREAVIAYMNAFHGAGIKMDYSTVPHAVFCQPEVASVGLREDQAIEKYGKENVLIGFEEMKSTGKGQGLNAKGFAKIIINRETERIIGAHIVGKAASLLIQEVATVMALNAPFYSILHAIHIHPSLSEVVSWACGNLMSVDDYNKMIEKEFQISSQA